jgi:hypothetical protein
MIAVSRACAKEVAMAKVIEFYIPKNFQKSLKWLPELQRGKTGISSPNKEVRLICAFGELL